MIKDVMVNLEQRFDRDPARDFAISAAASFDAHLSDNELPKHRAACSIGFSPEPTVEMSR